jgi:hypothetical protein
MKMPNKIDNNMLAPCGVNCMTCYKHLAKKNSCCGCKSQGKNISKHCGGCKIRNCAANIKQAEHCFNCNDYPCDLIKRLNKSYTQRYKIDLIKN